MQKRLSILLTVIIGASVNATSNPVELLKNLSYATDVGFNGVKGVGLGFIANACTVNGYAPYAFYRAAELKDQGSSKEVANRIGQVVGSVLGAWFLFYSYSCAVDQYVDDTVAERAGV